DASRGETLLVRDRFGKKPLCYGPVGRGLAFASELSALRAHPRVSAELDACAVALYLTFNAVPAPATLLRAVRKVPAGSFGRLHDGAFHEETYGRPRIRPGPGDAAIDRLDDALARAVRRRIPDGVAFGVFLSGGVDSALVAALAARESAEPLRTYSVGFPDAPSFDESAQALRLARVVGSRHAVRSLRLRRLADESHRALALLDEPVADPSFLPTTVLT